MNTNIRNLRVDEIEVRQGSLTEKGVTLLLYKNARVDQAILDETYGIMGWQRHHALIGSELYCTVSVWDEQKNCWIEKQDVGVESYSEKVKGAASDSFKRACFNLGIGRELYTAPFIFLPISRIQVYDVKGKLYVKDRFSVAQIRISKAKEITALELINQRAETVFSFQKPVPDTAATEAEKQELYGELARTGISLQTVLDRYQVASMEEMEHGTCQKALSGLRKSKAA